jgi:hypothetical protein
MTRRRDSTILLRCGWSSIRVSWDSPSVVARCRAALARLANAQAFELLLGCFTGVAAMLSRHCDSEDVQFGILRVCPRPSAIPATGFAAWVCTATASPTDRLTKAASWRVFILNTGGNPGRVFSNRQGIRRLGHSALFDRTSRVSSSLAKCHAAAVSLS